jgi:hypothetical protein
VQSSDRITFPALDATIVAIASDAASAAGGNPTISCFDELWGYVSERSRRLWGEMITSPARKISCRLTTSYAGFTGESVLLEELHKRAMALPEIGPSLRAGDGCLFAWHVAPEAPWQDERWLAEMRRSLRPSAHDHQRVRVERKPVRRSRSVGRVCAVSGGEVRYIFWRRTGERRPGDMPLVGRRDTFPCMHSGESEKCGQPLCGARSGWTAT